MTTARFGVLEIVRIVIPHAEDPDALGKVGAVVGFSQAPTGEWSYAIYFLDHDEDGWMFEERQLASTGRFCAREEIYPGDRIRVRVDPATGEGTIVEGDESTE